MRLSCLLGLLLITACGSDDGGSGSNPDAGSGGTGGGSGCPDGYRGCPCIDVDICNGALVCNGNICEEAPEETCPEGTLGCPCGSGCETDSHCESSVCVKDEPVVDVTCSDHTECDDSEMCIASGCIAIDWLYFSTTVEYALPESCDAGLSGVKDLYFDYVENGFYKLSSPTVECPGIWSDFPFVYDSLSTFALSFWDEDLLGDEFQASFCWAPPNGDCATVPDSVLRAGTFSDTLDTLTIELVFEPCDVADGPSCPR